MPGVSDDDDLRAAELAFRLIEGDERRAAEARLADDPDFAAAYVRWQGYVLAMLGGRDEAPRPSLWPEIAARLPANDAGPAMPAVRRWQFATFAASAAVLLLGVVAVSRATSVAPPAAIVQVAATAPLVAVLTGTGTGAVVAVSFDKATQRLTLAPAALDPARRAAELWVIPAGGKPRSLGVMRATDASWQGAPVAAAGAIVPGATLAITLEPAGGSPSGQPTGPVIVSGIVKST